MDFEKEHIPSEDNVARFIFKPNHYENDEFRWNKAFQFPKPIEQGESVCWERYAATEQVKHQIGAEILQIIQKRKSDASYMGFRMANVGMIRDLKNARGHGFEVDHKPSEEEGKHHAEVMYFPCQELDLKPTDRAELKEMLEGVFALLAVCNI